MIPSSIKAAMPSALVFPRGVLLISLEAAMDFDQRGKSEDAQARDRDTGFRLWIATGVDMEEPEEGARFRRTAEVKVKVISAQRPVVPPSTVPGYPPRVEFEELTLSPWLDQQRCTGPKNGERHQCRARVAYSLRASGIRAFTGSASAGA
jgi:hypothetical protein